MQRREGILAAIAGHEQEIKDSQVTVFNREIKLRSEILTKLGHIDQSGVLQLKGRAACEIDTADELMASELMFNGVFNSLNAHEAVALASCLVPVEKSQDSPVLKPKLAQALQTLRATAEKDTIS